MIRVDQNQAAMGWGNTSINASSQLPDNFSAILQTQGKSQSMDDIFQEASRTYEVPIDLLKAVAKAESNFDPKALSHCGAQGIMQLMPKTAASLGVTDAFDPKQNIMGGAKYLGQMLERYDGDTKLALAAYNAGSGNVKKYGGIPPFKETRNYVEKVMEYAGENISAGNVPPTASFLGGVPQTGSDFGDYSDFNSQLLQFEGFTVEDYQMFVESLKMNLASLSDTVENNSYLWNSRIQKNSF